jgi:flagellar basal body rod protein FlgG
MLDALYNAAEAMHRATTDFETVSHNLANVSTAGFRRIVTQHPETQQSHLGEGPVVARPQDDLALDLIQGSLIQSGSYMDIALQGPGFIELAGPEGSIDVDSQSFFTRDGRLQVNSDGLLVSNAGRPVQGEDGGTIKIPVGAEFSIDPQGGVFADGVQVGTISIKEYVNRLDVSQAGDGMYRIANAIDAEKTIVSQGFQEASNVSAVRELVRMIEAMRRYEAAQKTITSVSEAVQRHTTSS